MPGTIYSATNTFYLLSLLMNHDQTLKYTFYYSGFCMLILTHEYKFGRDEDSEDSQEEVKVFFYPHHIDYVIDSHRYSVDWSNSVDYLYYVMSHMSCQWIKDVLQHVKPKRITRLATLAKMALPNRVEGESMLRRMFTRWNTAYLDMCNMGRQLSPQEYADYFKSSLGECSNIWDMDVPNEEKESIYMHDFNFFGDLSHKMNLYSLGHLLAMEAILLDCHKWYEIFPNCHYCKIEKFHITIWRLNWYDNVEISIFLEDEMCKMIKHGSLPKQSTREISHQPDLLESLFVVELRFEILFAKEYFSKKRKSPFRMFTMKEWALHSMGLLVFMRRLFLFCQQEWTAADVNNSEAVETSSDFKSKMLKAREYFKQPLDGTHRTYMIKGVAYHYEDQLMEEQVESIWKLGTQFPFEPSLAIYRWTQCYRLYGPVIGSDNLRAMGNVFFGNI